MELNGDKGQMFVRGVLSYWHLTPKNEAKRSAISLKVHLTTKQNYWHLTPQNEAKRSDISPLTPFNY